MKTLENKLVVYPSILTDDTKVAAHQLQLVRQAAIAVVQLDIVDGFYADNLTMTPSDFAEFDFGETQVDFHLMVEEPLDYVYEILDHKEYLPVRAVIAQIEKMSNQTEFVKLVQDMGWQAGLSLDLHTPFESITADLLPEIDVIQVMGIEAGFQGQQFLPQALDQLRQAVLIRTQQNLKFQLIADGGIKKELVSSLMQIGVNGVAVGSGLWNAKDFSQMYQEYQ